MFPVYDFSLDDGSSGVGAASTPVSRAPLFCTDPGGANVWPVEIVEDCRCPNIPVPTARAATAEEVRIQAKLCHSGPNIRPGGSSPGQPNLDTGLPSWDLSPGATLQQAAPTQGMGRMWWMWLLLIGGGGYYWYKKQGS